MSAALAILPLIWATADEDYEVPTDNLQPATNNYQLHSGVAFYRGCPIPTC